jgi:acetyltransferase-like isoleucine patch superfamily enzyme
MFAWGVVVSDVWPATGSSIAERRAAIRAASTGCRFRVPAAQPPRPILIDDNVWVGFNSVIMPGVTIGRGAVIGANTVVSRDVEPYTVVVGNPPVVVRRLPATDSPEALRSARDALKD